VFLTVLVVGISSGEFSTYMLGSASALAATRASGLRTSASRYRCSVEPLNSFPALKNTFPGSPAFLRGSTYSVQGLGVRSQVANAIEPQAIQRNADSVLESDRVLIAPAIQTADLAMLGPEIDKAVKGGADVIHCDIMDGHFTEKLTFGPMFIKSLRKYGITAPIDVHIMADGIVDHLIEEFADAGANYITFHPEGVKHTARSLDLIKSRGLKCGLVINPGTPLFYLDHVMDKVDLILLMSVNPGFKKQGFQEVTYSKAREIKRMIDKSGRKIRLEVDGRVGSKNIEALAQAGIDMFVVGGSIFNSDDYGRTISELRGLAEKAVVAA